MKSIGQLTLSISSSLKLDEDDPELKLDGALTSGSAGLKRLLTLAPSAVADAAHFCLNYARQVEGTAFFVRVHSARSSWLAER